MNIRTLFLRLRYPRVSFGPGFQGPIGLRIRGKGRIVIGRDVHIRNDSGKTALLTLQPSARIEIGDRVEIDGAGIMAASAIAIGHDAILGPCLLVDTDFHAIGPGRRREGETAERRAIRLEANAWVQGKATVLKGVTIGRDAVVRWGALVAGDVAPGTVVVGNPAVEVPAELRRR